jgi:hypothetical protein
VFIALLHLIMELLLLFIELLLEQHLLLSETGLDCLLDRGSFLHFMLDKSDSCCLKLVMPLLSKSFLVNLGHELILFGSIILHFIPIHFLMLV